MPGVCRGLMDGWKQAGVGPSLAGMVSLVSCGLRCGARRKSELRWEQAAEKVPRRNFPLKLKIDVLPCDSFIIMKTLFKIGCKEQVKVKNKVSVFLSAGSVGGCNRSSLSNDSRQCKEFGGDGVGSRDWLICALRHSSVQFSSILRSALWSPSHDHRSRNQRPRTLLPPTLGTTAADEPSRNWDANADRRL